MFGSALNSLLFKKTPHDGAIRQKQKQQVLLGERERVSVCVCGVCGVL